MRVTQDSKNPKKKIKKGGDLMEIAVDKYGLIALLFAIPLCAKDDIMSKKSPHLLGLYLSSTIAEPIVDYENRTIKKLTETEKLVKAILKTELRKRPMGGVFTTYLGFVDVLGVGAFAVFPLKHAESEVTIIVVKRMYPIITQGQTVERFIRKKSEPAAYYRLKRTKDSQSADVYWETTKIETPKDLTIPAQAIVICAKPEEIFIPEGTTTAIPGPHLFLPDIFPTPYFKRGMETDVMTFVKISPYFEPVRMARRLQKDRVAQMIEFL